MIIFDDAILYKTDCFLYKKSDMAIIIKELKENNFEIIGGDIFEKIDEEEFIYIYNNWYMNDEIEDIYEYSLNYIEKLANDENFIQLVAVRVNQNLNAYILKYKYLCKLINEGKEYYEDEDIELVKLNDRYWFSIFGLSFYKELI